MARAKGFNRAAINGFFDIIEAEFVKHNYTPNRIFNVDETGLSVVQSKIPKSCCTERKKVGAMTSAERESLVAAIGCVSSAGTYVPPMIIFPQEKLQQPSGQESLHVPTI